MRLTHFLTQGKRRIILTYRRVIQPHHKVPFSYDCFVHLLSIIIFSTGASAMTSIPKPNHFFLLHCIVYLYEHTACELWFWVRKESNKLNFHALPLPPLNYHLCQHIVIKPFEPYVVFVVTVGVFFYRSKVFLSLFKEHSITQQWTVICNASQCLVALIPNFPNWTENGCISTFNIFISQIIV